MQHNVTDQAIGAEQAGTAVGAAALVLAGYWFFLTKDAITDKPMAIKDMPVGYKTLSEAEQKEVDAYEKRQELPTIQWLLSNIRWLMATYIVLVHVLAVVSLPYLLTCKTQTLFGAVALYFAGGFGVTGGLHRLWSHKTYKANAVYRFAVMICSSIANQGTIYHWSRDHRTHHKYSETKADPHNALRGFFFAHVGWLLFKKDPRVKFAGKHIKMDDLDAMPEVVLQKKLDPLWNLFWCFFFPALVGHYGWGESFYTAFLVMGVFKYVFTLHGTWLVNSAAHLYGGHPYDEHQHPAENPMVSLISMGEGWHNWHHAFPHDYAASELGVSSQYNPTKLFIDIAAMFGLVWERRRALDLWDKRQKNNDIKLVGTEGPLFLRQRVVKKAI